jgi:maltooligosyltrehalose trehalohydrolase
VEIGAQVVTGGVRFRVWAPEHERVAVVIDGRDFPLEREAHGYFAATVAEAKAGTLYRYRIDGDEETYPDPVSRFQPEGAHGPSQVIDPTRYQWRDQHWRGIPSTKGRVFYELHVGTFTKERTYAAAIEHLPALAELGINTIELMPVNEFAGEFGWGYDGVDLFAPTHLYGTPDDLRRFIDAAHEHEIAVLLDVVYNHLGPDGDYLQKFTKSYVTDKYKNDWGDALNFDCEGSHGVRTFFRENAAYWIREFHFDGFRIDATQSLNDETEPHILRELTDAARRAAGERGLLIVGENEPQNRAMLTEYGLDALGNDDWHHAARVALTGKTEAYYTDYRGRAQEFISMVRSGFLYQGQRYAWQKKRRGTPSRDLAPERFVCYLQNHDQIANGGHGKRIHELTSPGRYRAMTALLLLQPQTPMLFQGQEFAASAPFLYFAHHTGELAEKVEKGRREFVEQFPSMKGAPLAAPHERATLELATLDQSERQSHRDVVELHRELLALRREQPFVQQRNDCLEGSALTDECLVLRWFTGGEDDRLLLVNLGRDLPLDPAPEPLLAPPAGFNGWKKLWTTEPMPEPEIDGRWKIAGHSAAVLRPA